MGASVSSIISQTPLPIPAPLQSATPNPFSSSIHFFKPAPKETTMQRAFLSHNPVPKTQQILHRFRKLDAGCFPSECLWVHDVMETEESKICRIFGYYRGEDLESIDEEANKAISERCLRMFVNSVIRRRLRKLERGRVLVRNEPSLAPRAAFDPARCTSNGNMKLLEDLVLAAPEGVLVNADSEFYANNIQNIVSAARIPGKKFNVLRRINLDVDPQVDIFLDAAVLLVNYIDQIWDQGFETDYLSIEGQLGIDYQSGAVLPTDLIEVVRELVLTRDLNLIIEPGRSPTADTSLVNPVTETNGTKKTVVMVGSVSELICPRLYVAYQVGKRDSFLFTSESVTEGHPDKLCDQISDKVVDACLEQDPDSKVTCETWTKNNIVVVVGKITTKANVDYEKLIRDTCRDVGYVSDDVGLDADRCKVLLNIEQQSPDIAQGIHGHLTKHPENIEAGDQGHMFGYATDETPERMPLSHVLATKLGVRLTDVRKNGTCPWLGPDGKTQVTIEYFNDNGAMFPIRVHTVVISTQHDETVTKDEIEAGLMEHVIKHVIPQKYLDEKTIFHLNPSGRFVIGGPRGDAGLTGRKIIVDTYGGWGSHGGGAFSGKDPTKLDRSGAYLCRQVAKSIVDNRLARRCSMQVSYVPGVPEPSSLFVDTYGTGKIPDMEILKIVKENFDFRPGMIAINLDLKRGGNGRFSKTAAYGHFGREDPDFTWEVVKLLKMGETPAVKFLQFK